MNKQLYVSAYTWRYIMIYAEKGYMHGYTETIRRRYQKGLLIFALITFLYLFVVWAFTIAIQQYGDTLSFLWKWGGAVVVYGILVWLAYNVYTKYKAFKEKAVFEKIYPEPGERIPLYNMTKDGIDMNYYNRPNEKLSHRWQDAKYAEIVNTEYPPIFKTTKDGRKRRDTSQMIVGMRREERAIREHYPDFPYKPELQPEGQISIQFTMKNTKRNTFPIPAEWFQDDTAEQFIQHVRNHMDGNFLEQPEEMDLLNVFFPDFYARYFQNFDDR